MDARSSEEFRKLAKETLAVAQTLGESDCRRALILLASSYEEMAKKLEDHPRLGRWDLP